MFKYTPPWQVLCNSLDHNFKRQAPTVTVNPNVASTQERAVLSFHSTLKPSLPRSDLNHPPSRVPMTSNPKRWVIKPFSPKLQHFDLRTILSPTDQPQSLEKTWSSSQDGDSFKFSLESTTVTGMQPTVMVSSGSGKSTPDVMVQARQVAVSEDGSDSEDWRPSTPSNPSSPNSSTGSHVGFYSFVDDPACPEAELNEVYMVSPKRQAKLNTLKEKSTFKLQTYAEGKRPGRLFEETNGDDRYQMEDTFAVNKKEENPNRMEIIRNQAPKKSPALKEQWSALENLDLSNTPQRLLDGFSLLYKPMSANTEQARVEPGTIDNEQIDFNTARKQFLLMEQSKPNLQHLPYSPKMRGRITSSTASIFTPKDTSRENSLEENQITLAIQEKTEINTVTEDREDEVLSGDVDSGLGERSGGYTSDGSISNDPSISEVESSLTLLSAEETPIQREIRISREREEDLRRSRGILRTDTLEMVEIRTKPILSQSSSQIKAAKAKESNRVSFFIQRELELEKQRQFTVPYHNSENQALDKKASFEPHPQEIPNTNLKPSQQESPTNDLEQKRVSADDMWITEQPVLVEEGDLSGTKEVLSPCCPHRHPDESMLQRNTDCSMSGNKDQTGPYSEGNNYSKVKVYFENGVDSQTSNLGRPKNSSWIVETDKSMSRRNRLYSPTILSQLDPEKTSWYTPAWRSHSESTEWSPKLQNAPNSIRQEIEEDLRREQELQELRESLSEPTPPVTSVKTSSEPRSPVTSNEDNVFSPETSHEHMKEVDSVPPEKKTDHSYPYSWSLATTSVSRLSMTDKSPQLFSPQQNSRLPSMSIMIPQPWGNPKPMSPSVSRVTPIKPLSAPTDLSSPISQKGLTETLLKDFEDRRVKLKLEESAYAGIQPTDAINNEVVEATRVTRHKNQRALQWEAGMYANQDS